MNTSQSWQTESNFTASDEIDLETIRLSVTVKYTVITQRKIKKVNKRRFESSAFTLPSQHPQYEVTIIPIPTRWEPIRFNYAEPYLLRILGKKLNEVGLIEHKKLVYRTILRLQAEVLEKSKVKKGA